MQAKGRSRCGPHPRTLVRSSWARSALRLTTSLPSKPVRPTDLDGSVVIDHRLVVVVIDPPYEAFIPEARSSGLCRGVDAPFAGCLELENDTPFDESRDGLFQNPSSGERLDRGSLSLDRDLRGGIGRVLDEHVAVMQDGRRGHSRAGMRG